MNQKPSTVTLYGDVKIKPVKWIWYPYIPVGKITLLQGDPGDGKSTMMLNIISEISKGGELPDGTHINRPRRVIYQCSEDGVMDTIKPRLEACKADCNNIAFLDEEVHSGLTLDDERIRDAIIEFKPWMVVIDPLQSYIESNSDLMMASKARRLLKWLTLWASTYNCAVVLIGHLNKSEGTKGLYRGLGRLVVIAYARSILQIEREHDIRTLKQIKNNLAPTGKDVQFEITRDFGFRWLDAENNEEKEVESQIDLPQNKHELAAYLLKEILLEKDVSANEVKKQIERYRISDRTLHQVKATLGIRSIRKAGKWYWSMPGAFNEE